MLLIPEASLQVYRVVASAMSRNTFALVQPSRRLVENRDSSATGDTMEVAGESRD